MRCEEVLEQLPDFTLGTLSEEERAQIRRHLRGCGACRAEAATLDEGMAMFASAAHAVDPPEELRGQVMSALAEEWGERPVAGRRRAFSARFALAAAITALVGALAWGTVAQISANRNGGDAASYHRFLAALGGKDVRVATLQPASNVPLEGQAVLYDSDHGQSWGLVLVRGPGLTGPIQVQLSGTSGRAIKLRTIEMDPDGEGSTWFVTAADVSAYRTVRLYGPDGRLLAAGTAGSLEG